MSPEVMVTCNRAEKRYGDTVALDNLTLSLQRGQIYGLLGSNGAGKSTLLTSILGQTVLNAGTCEVMGTPSLKLRDEQLERIGYVEQESKLLPWMRAGQYLALMAAFYPQWDHALQTQLVSRFEIRSDKRIKTMSPGERQRLAIIAAIAHRPELVLLDEPASALDHLARRELLSFLIELMQDQKRCILLSSHILSDIEKVVSQVIFLRKGKLTLMGGLDELKETHCKILLHGQNCSPESIRELIPSAGVLRGSSQETVAVIATESVPLIRAQALKLGANFDTRPVTLEELYEAQVRE